jgi:hypothetical protein
MALRAWFYPGDNFGQEFPYPKHLATMGAASVTTVPQLPAAQPHPVETAPAPQLEQMGNTRRNYWITINGERRILETE